MSTAFEQTPLPNQPDERPGGGLESLAAEVGEQLGRSLERVVNLVPTPRQGPVALAEALKVDKVLTSRLLKALRQREPLAIAHLAPGPEPLRRLIRAAAENGVPSPAIDDAVTAVNAFEALIRETAGDRSGLDALLSAWLPDTRQEFEVRRKQAAFKAMSELKGAACDVNFACTIVQPGDHSERLDVVWVFGSFGLRRLRPDVPVKFTSRRLADADAPRQPSSIDGAPVDLQTGLAGLRLDDFCSKPPPEVNAHHVGEVVHYTLGDHGFGPQSGVDLVFAEVNRNEIGRFRVDPERRTYFFAEVPIPARTLVFDVLLHEDVFPGAEPALTIYDTVLDGIASVNDRTRDIDRLDMVERLVTLGSGIARLRSGDVPRSPELYRTVFSRLGWEGDRFRGWRCRIDYPVYGSQVVMAFDPPVR